MAASPTPPSLPGPERRAGRRRDRHGHGPRGPLLPREVPAWRSRSQAFDEQVLDAVERLARRLPSRLDGIEFAVEDVPPSDPAPWEHDEVPLGRVFPAHGELPPRVVVYRRPVETRATGMDDLAPLVHEVVVEQVARLLGLTPEQIDPRYGDESG